MACPKKKSIGFQPFQFPLFWTMHQTTNQQPYCPIVASSAVLVIKYTLKPTPNLKHGHQHQSCLFCQSMLIRVQLKCDDTRWRKGGETGEWGEEASTLHTTSEHGVSSITTADAHTSAASSWLNWRPPADLNGLVCLAERRNLVSARVPSHFNRPLLAVLQGRGGIKQTTYGWSPNWVVLPPAGDLLF